MIDPLPLIQKLHLLESSLGHKYNHGTLEPFPFNSADPIAVQKAGKKIAEFIGIPGLTFIIAYATQKERVAGHIELDNNREVHIEIDSKYKDNHHIVLSVLAHEICHKYLQINNIRLFPEIENEILTDTATVFTGLGKLSLNGCETVSVSSNTTANITSTTTTTHKVGYLVRDQFAFIYRLVCEMRQIPKNVIYSTLNPEPATAVRQAESSFKKMFDKRFFDNKAVAEMAVNMSKNEIGDLQKLLAQLGKDIRIADELIMPHLADVLSSLHQSSKTHLQTLQTYTGASSRGAANDYLNNMLFFDVIKNMKHKTQEHTADIYKITGMLAPFIDKSIGSYAHDLQNKGTGFLFEFSCPACQHKMRIGEKKLARVKCPGCQYSFVVDTGAGEIFTITGKSALAETRKKGRVLDKVRSFFDT